MHVISLKRIRDFFTKHRDAEQALLAWYRVARRSRWKDLAELKLSYPHADLVGELTVINIKGNHYRLVVRINYGSGTVFVKGVYTHSEYDNGEWKT